MVVGGDHEITKLYTKGRDRMVKATFRSLWLSELLKSSLKGTHGSGAANKRNS